MSNSAEMADLLRSVYSSGSTYLWGLFVIGSLCASLCAVWAQRCGAKCCAPGAAGSLCQRPIPRALLAGLLCDVPLPRSMGGTLRESRGAAVSYLAAPRSRPPTKEALPVAVGAPALQRDRGKATAHPGGRVDRRAACRARYIPSALRSGPASCDFSGACEDESNRPRHSHLIGARLRIQRHRPAKRPYRDSGLATSLDRAQSLRCDAP